MPMLAPDKGTRTLLPILNGEPGEVVLAAEDDGGQVRQIPAPELPAHHAASANTDPASGAGSSLQGSGIPAQGQPVHTSLDTGVQPSSSSIAAHLPDTSHSFDPAGIHADGASAWSGSGSARGASSLSTGGSPHASGMSKTGSLEGPPSAQVGTGADPESLGTEGPDVIHDSAGPSGLDTLPGTPGALETPVEAPDGDDIHIVQTALVDQDADVLLNGWMGDSKIRIFMDNDADMDQDVDIDLDHDGNGGMFLRLDQWMTIDQETEIDLDIYEVMGILYVDLWLKNEVDLEQDTELDLMMGGWNGESRILADNHLAVRQHTDVDVDIDDDLEAQFDIKVAVGIKQAIRANQDADIDLSYTNGSLGVDVDATQTALIDQDTTLKIDFSVI